MRQEISVSLYGEVQKEVIQATLAGDFGLEVELPRDHDDLHRAAGRRGAAAEVISRPPNPFLAAVGLRVEPGRRRRRA